MTTRRGTLDVKLHVLVAAVTAAERKLPMPSTADLVEQIGGTAHGISMAVAGLERKGILARLDNGGRRRVLIRATGAATAETRKEA